MTGRLIFSTIGVPKAEDDMWSPAFREGKWGVTEAGRMRREASWKTVRLAVSLRRGSNVC